MVLRKPAAVLAAVIAVSLPVLLPLAARAADEPEAVYQKFHRAVRASNQGEMFKYATEQRRREVAAAPQFQVALIAETLPESYEITAKQFSPDHNRAQLRMTGMHSFLGGKKAPMYGIIDLVKLKGEWKVDKMGWAQDQWPQEKLH